MFRHMYICNECNSEFVIHPLNECPVCKLSKEITTEIQNMTTGKEYLLIKQKIAGMRDGIPQFDLYNLINRTRKRLGL